MEHLLSCTNVKQMRQALTSMPSNLADAYESTWERILKQPSHRANLATKVIGWVTHSERHLKVDEPRHALAVEEDATAIDAENLTARKIILQVCIGLIYIDPIDDTINMIHFSACEYFRQLGGQFPKIQFELATKCISYLGCQPMSDGACGDVEVLRDRINNMPLLGYAAESWGNHARQVGPEMKGRILQILKDDNIRASSFQALAYREVSNPRLATAIFESLPTRLKPLHVAAYWDLGMSGEILLKEGDDPNVRDAQNWTPLHWACSRGSTEMMDYLLRNGANVDALDLSGWSPLFWAAIKGHKQIVERLLIENANHLLQDVNSWTVLQWAASRGHPAITQILLEHHSKSKASQNSVEIRVKDLTVEHAKKLSQSLQRQSGIKTPIEIAADSQDTDTFETILEDLATREAGQTSGELWEQRGWDEPRVYVPWRVLSKADHFDKKGLQRWDIREKSNSSDEWKTKLLHGAIRDGKVLIVQLLVELGANIQNPYRSSTPLQQASLLKDPEIVKILLAKGACVPDEKSELISERQSPLHLAVACGFDRTVKALLEGGVDVDVKNTNDETPLVLACGISAQVEDHGSKSLLYNIVKMLIDHGARVCETQKQGSNALHSAAKAERPDIQIIKLLIENGINANATNRIGLTPFHDFCRASHGWGYIMDPDREEVFNLLLAHSPPGVENIDCQYMDWDGEPGIAETPLAIALQAENWSSFHLLLAKGATLRTTRSLDDLLWKSAYVWALQPKAVGILLNLGASATAKRDGTTPMGHCAIKGFFNESLKSASRLEDLQFILNMYLERELDVNATDRENQSLLHLTVIGAQEKDESALTEYLLRVGADPYQPICGAWDSFLLAAIHGRLSALRVLLSHASKTPNPTLWLHLPDSSLPSTDSSILSTICTSLQHASLLESPDPQSLTPLQKAVSLSNTTTTSTLLSHSANLHITDTYGWTLLHTASYNNDLPIAKLLLSAGCSPTATTTHWAGGYKRPSNLNANDVWTGTSLHLAAMIGSPAIVSLLLSHGADVHASTGSCMDFYPGHGPTALHIALDTGRFYGERPNLSKRMLEVARMLVEHGADVRDVAARMDWKHVCRFEGVEELWERLRAGIFSEGKKFTCEITRWNSVVGR